MRRKILVVCVAFYASLNLFGQSLDIDWGDSFDSNTEVQKILGFIDGKMYAFSMKGKKYFLDQHSENGFAQVASNEYKVPEIDGFTSGLLNITITEKDILAIVYGYSKKTKSFVLFAQPLKPNGQSNGKMKELYKSTPIDDKIKDPVVDVRFSPDNKKMLVFFDRSDKDRLNFSSDVVVVDLFSIDLNTVVEKLNFSMRDGRSDNSEFKVFHTVENSGKFFFLTQRIEFEKKVISNFELEVIGFESNGKKLGSTKIKDKESMLLEPTIIATDKGYSIVGYYTSNPRKRAKVVGYAGIFHVFLDETLTVSTINKNELSNKFFTNLYSDRYIRKKSEKKEEILVPAPYTMDKIMVHSDGSMTILSEFYQITIRTDNRGATTTTTNYGSIIYYKLDKEGNLTGADVIKKNQASSTQTIGLGIGAGAVGMFVNFETKDKLKKYWSYASYMKDNIVYLVFNDHRKNEVNEDGEISKSLINPKKGFPYLATITPDGKYTKKGMAGANDDETYCAPQVSLSLGVDGFILWGVRKKENKFGLASIK